MRLSTRGAGNDCRNDRSSSTRGVSCDAPQGAEQEHRRCELRRPARSGARAPEVRVATPRKERSKSTRGVSCDAPQGAEQEHRRCELRLSERQEFEHRRCELRRPARSGARAPEVRVATPRKERSKSTGGASCDAPQGAEQEHRRCELRLSERQEFEKAEGLRVGITPLSCGVKNGYSCRRCAFLSARRSMAGRSTALPVASFPCQTARSTNPLPMSLRMTSVV